jgi:hypothetical protein
MFRCALAVVLFFAMLASGFYASAGEPTMAEHHLVQEQTPLLADSCGEGPTGKQPPTTGDFSDTAETDSGFDGPALCNSVPAKLTFVPRSATAIPFTPVVLLQPFSDGLRRPPRAGLHLA